jgi:hypothetical protein
MDRRDRDERVVRGAVAAGEEYVDAGAADGGRPKGDQWYSMATCMSSATAAWPRTVEKRA